MEKAVFLFFLQIKGTLELIKTHNNGNFGHVNVRDFRAKFNEPKGKGRERETNKSKMTTIADHSLLFF